MGRPLHISVGTVGPGPDVAFVTTTTEKGVCTLTLSRSERRNALSAEVLHDLINGLRQAVVEKCRVVVLTGAGAQFSSGGDLKSTSNEDTAPLYQEVFSLLRDAPQPTIARVNGSAIGGAIGLVAACDLAIAATNATFSFPEVQLGMAPTLAALVVVPRVGMAWALDLFLLGQPISAQRAVEIGLVSRAVPPEQLDEELLLWTSRLLAATPAALSACKRLARDLVPRPQPESYEWVCRLTSALKPLGMGKGT